MSNRQVLLQTATTITTAKRASRQTSSHFREIPMWRVVKDCVFQGNFTAKEVDMTGKTVVITGPSRGGILAMLGPLRSQKKPSEDMELADHKCGHSAGTCSAKNPTSCVPATTARLETARNRSTNQRHRVIQSDSRSC